MFTAGAEDKLPANAALQYQHARSPLDILVRKTSVRRKDNFPVTQKPLEPGYVAIGDPLQQPITPETQMAGSSQYHLDSPLLHSRFARDSCATASSKDMNSYLARSSSQSGYFDDESVYSDDPPSAAIGDYPWPSPPNHGPTLVKTSLDDSAYAGIEPNPPRHFDIEMSQCIPPVPTVIVSSIDSDVQHRRMYSGRPPIIAASTPNFSRPGRPVIPRSDEEKRRVLERNFRRVPNPSSSNSQQYQPSPLSPSPSPLATAPFTATATTSPQLSDSRTFDTSSSNLSPPITLSVPNTVSLPRGPPPRSLSPATSLYSSYSYYPYENIVPLSPSNPRSPTPIEQPQLKDQIVLPSAPVNEVPNQGPQTPQEYLQLGIQCHEANKLEDSAKYFEKSAKENSGCGVGMLMWGLALRHGWGCQKDEKKGFNWLRRAAESAVEDLENSRIGGGLDPNAVQTELVLAIYEVGQCFFQGWGVPKDQKMAVSYYRVAARLGDSDAQSDLAFCLANGKGCKKDRKEAAKWYRAAVAQGQSDVGLAWIYKEKYQ